MKLEDKIQDKKVQNEIFRLGFDFGKRPYQIEEDRGVLDVLCRAYDLSDGDVTIWVYEESNRIRGLVYPRDTDYFFDMVDLANHVDSFIGEDTWQDKKDELKWTLQTIPGLLLILGAYACVGLITLFEGDWCEPDDDIKCSSNNKENKKSTVKEKISPPDGYQSERAREIGTDMRSFTLDFKNLFYSDFFKQNNSSDYLGDMVPYDSVHLSEELFEEQLRKSLNSCYCASLNVDIGTKKYDRFVDCCVNYFKEELYPKIDKGEMVIVGHIVFKRIADEKIEVKYLGDEQNARIAKYALDVLNIE